MSPLTRRMSAGRYCAAVSIRSGIGSMTHDRVMRLEPVFATQDQAARFATRHAIEWIGGPPAAQQPTIHPTSE